MYNILLFESNQEKISHLVFLLKLADIHCTVARTAEEVLNWISACRMMVIKFDLVLISSLQGSGLENMLLTELCHSATVPIVCVERQCLPLSKFLHQHIITCHSDDLLNCLKEHLVSTNKQLPEEEVE